MANTKPLFLTIITAVLLLVLPVSTQAEEMDAERLAYSQGWDKGVAIVVNYDQREYGTGWFIHQRYVVTAYHVVEGGYNIRVIKGGFQANAQIVAFDQSRDVAILELEREYADAHVFPLTTDIQKGGRIYVIGFPFELVMLQGYNFAKASMNPRVGMGTASWFDSNRLLLELGTYTDSGNSGGPVVDDLGRAVGLVTFAVKGTAATMYFATTSHAVAELAARNGIPYNMDNSERQDQFAVISVDTDDPALAFALVGFGAVVSVLTTMVVAKRR